MNIRAILPVIEHEIAIRRQTIEHLAAIRESYLVLLGEGAFRPRPPRMYSFVRDTLRERAGQPMHSSELARLAEEHGVTIGRRSPSRHTAAVACSSLAQAGHPVRRVAPATWVWEAQS